MPIDPYKDILRYAQMGRTMPYAQAPNATDVETGQAAAQDVAAHGGFPDISSLLPPGTDLRTTQLAAPAQLDLEAVKAAQEKAAMGAALANIPVTYTRLAAMQGKSPDLRSPYAAYMQKMGEGDQQRLEMQRGLDQKRIDLLNTYITGKTDATKQYMDANAQASALTAQNELNRTSKEDIASDKTKAVRDRTDQAARQRNQTDELRKAALKERIASNADKRAKQDKLVDTLDKIIQDTREQLNKMSGNTGYGIVDIPRQWSREMFTKQKAEFERALTPLNSHIGQVTITLGDQQRVALMQALKAFTSPQWNKDMASTWMRKLDTLATAVANHKLTRADEEARHADTWGGVAMEDASAPTDHPTIDVSQPVDEAAALERALAAIKNARAKKGK